MIAIIQMGGGPRDGGEREREVIRIMMCYVHGLTTHNEYTHYVSQTHI